jgi:hypothetical protein
MKISDVVTDTAKLYRRLFARSFLAALLIFLPISLVGALPALGVTSRVGGVVVVLLSTVLTFVGTLLVQGALAHAVEDVHRDRSQAPIGSLYERTRGSLGSLVGGSILATLGIGLALLALAVPGLVLWTRWSLIVPVIVLERIGARDAFRRSRVLVRGHGWRVFWLLVILFGLTNVLRFVGGVAFAFLPPFPQALIGSLVVQAIVTPFQAHALTALYYRLREPDRPVVPERPRRWESIWDEERERARRRRDDP